MSIAGGRPATSESAPQPAWDIALLFPYQGQWSEEEFLALNTNRFVELSDGRIEVLDMPTTSHQFIAMFLYRSLHTFVAARALGVVLAAPMVRLGPKRIREPDVAFLLVAHSARVGEACWEGADLVMEVVSHDRRHDLVTKRLEYAEAGIPEYWIVDPQEARITVLRLEGASYIVHGEFDGGARATSILLPGFAVDVTAALSASQ